MISIDYKWRLVLVVLVGDFMVFLDTTLTNIALPTIIRSLNTTLDRGQLVLTMYILALAGGDASYGLPRRPLWVKAGLYWIHNWLHIGVYLVLSILGHKFPHLLPHHSRFLRRCYRTPGHSFDL